MKTTGVSGLKTETLKRTTEEKQDMKGCQQEGSDSLNVILSGGTLLGNAMWFILIYLTGLRQQSHFPGKETEDR